MKNERKHMLTTWNIHEFRAHWTYVGYVICMIISALDRPAGDHKFKMFTLIGMVLLIILNVCMYMFKPGPDFYFEKNDKEEEEGEEGEEGDDATVI